MTVIVSSRHMDVSPALKTFAEQKANKLTKYYDRIQEIEVVFDADGKDSIQVEMIVNAEHRNMFIARQGFEALRIVDSHDEVATILADASYGAPFLMQQLCHDYALAIGVTRRGSEDVGAREPGDWTQFLSRVADRTQPGVFEKLLKGPDPRGTSRSRTPGTTT